jgi:hypothetical protein
MIRAVRYLLIVGLLAVPAALWADDEAYTIKVKKGAKGSVTQVDKEDTEEAKVKIEGPDGKVLKDDTTKTVTKQAYKETVLEKPDPDKKATRLEREYTTAVQTAGDKEQTAPYQGKKVVIEKKDGKYHFLVDDKELTGKDVALLNKSFNGGGADDSEQLEKLIFPQKPVKVGETWKIDAEALAKNFQKGAGQLPIDAAKVSATGKLLKAYKKDGKQFGVLDIHIELPLKGDLPLGPGGAKAALQAGSQMTLKIKADTCIDGTASDAVAEQSMEMKLDGVIKGPDGKDYKLIIRSTAKGKDTEKDVSKK